MRAGFVAVLLCLTACGSGKALPERARLYHDQIAQAVADDPRREIDLDTFEWMSSVVQDILTGRPDATRAEIP